MGKSVRHTSIALINFSVSASSSHLHSSTLSGLVATTLRGPMVASEISLRENQSQFVWEQACTNHVCDMHTH